MKRSKWIFVALCITVITLVACFLHFWRVQSIRNDKVEILCEASVYAALEHFEEYSATAKESDYIAGVAEFRTYMRAYLVLVGESDTNYIWCNILYGDMILNPEKVKAHIPELVDALEYLAEDYDHPNGFHLINTLNNLLKTE